jgi:apolipoprotein N-acyltransferase
LISPFGELISRYDKVHLVPFGEMIPLEKFLKSLRSLIPQSGDFSRGAGFYPLNIYLREKKKTRFGVLICFEAIFGYISRSFVNRGANFLVNITNDAWSKNIPSHYQHFEMAIFRCIENRLFLIRAANSGVSAIINPFGVVEDYLEVYEKGILTKRISTKNWKSFYSAFGDLFVYSCFLVFGLIIVIGIMEKGRYIP